MADPTPLEKVQALADQLAEGAQQAKAEQAERRAAMSTNDRAEQLMGRRQTGVIPFDMPCEQGYRCPVCVVEEVGAEDEGIEWSEYNGFLWCERCNRDYPSVLCVPLVERSPDEPSYRHAIGPDAAVKVFLDTVEQAIKRENGR